ncbi:Calnexin [Dirofilaria immitis]|nr:Calnexin [Dirofilaria immitis]
MRRYWWLCLMPAGLLLVTCVAHDETDSNDNGLDEKNVVDEEEKMQNLFYSFPCLEYLPPPFQAPTIPGSPLLVDWFSNRNAIGQWEIGTPSIIVIDNDFGLIVKTRARHHAIAAKFNRPFKFDGKSLVVQLVSVRQDFRRIVKSSCSVQNSNLLTMFFHKTYLVMTKRKRYEVKYEEGQECGGGYVKLLTEGIEVLEEFTDKTPYTIMFGPDKCGAKSSILFIVRFKNPKNGTISEHHMKQPSKSVSTYFDDHKTHLYTLIVRSDETFTVLVDESKIMSGNLITDLEPSITPPTVIDDLADKNLKIGMNVKK